MYSVTPGATGVGEAAGGAVLGGAGRATGGAATGAGEGAMARAGTIAGYEAMQRGMGRRAEGQEAGGEASGQEQGGNAPATAMSMDREAFRRAKDRSSSAMKAKVKISGAAEIAILGLVAEMEEEWEVAEDFSPGCGASSLVNEDKFATALF